MRAALALLCLVVVAVSADPTKGPAKGGAPLQPSKAAPKLAKLRPARASPNQACTALHAGKTVHGTCWVAATCAKHKGTALAAVTAQAPGNKCPAGQSCCVAGLPIAPVPVPVKPVTPTPAPAKIVTPTPAKPVTKPDPCAARTGKASRYQCMTCVNTMDSNALKCNYDIRSGACFGSHNRYDVREAAEYARLLREKHTNYIADCERI